MLTISGSNILNPLTTICQQNKENLINAKLIFCQKQFNKETGKLHAHELHKSNKLARQNEARY